MADEIPGFDADEELEKLLTTPVAELDEDTRLKLQRYKSRKLKAKRDAGVSTDRPDWWGEGMSAPENASAAFEDGDEPAAATTRDAEQEAPAETKRTAEESATEEEPAAPEETSEGEAAEEPEAEPHAPAEEKSDQAPTREKPSPEKKKGVPQIGWSSGRPPEDEVSVDDIREKAEQKAEAAVQANGGATEDQPVEEETGEAAAEPEPAEVEQADAPEETVDEEAAAPEEATEEEAAEEPEDAAPPEAPSGEGPLHAGKFRIHVGPDPDQLPDFDADPELEKLLGEDIKQFDEEKRQEIQLYRSRKIKAMRDAGIEPDESTSLGSPAEAPAAVEPEPEATGEPEEPAKTTDETAEDEEPAAPEEAAEEEPQEEEGEEEPPEEEQEPTLTREELSEFPAEDELVQAGLIDQPIEQDDSEGTFFTTVDRKKAYLAYSRGDRFLTLYHYQVPTNVSDREWDRWVRDALARAAFEFAEQENLLVIPRASDVSRGFLLRHPEFFERVKPNSEARVRMQQRRLQRQKQAAGAG